MKWGQLFLLVLFFSCSWSKKNFLPLSEKKPDRFQLSWNKNLDPTKQKSGNLPIGTNSPLLTPGSVFVGDWNGKIQSFSLVDGRLQWSRDEGKPLGATVSLHDELILYGSVEGRVYARHFLTGELIYAIDLGSPVEERAAVDQDRAIFHLRNHQILCLDPKTGKILWSYKRSVPFNTTLQRVSVPMVIDQKVIVGFADGTVGALSLIEGVLLWEQKLTTKAKFIDVDVDPFYYQGKIWMGSADGFLKALDPVSGIPVQTLPFILASKPLVIGEDLYLATLDGRVLRVNDKGEILDQIKLALRGTSSLVQWKSQLVVATYDGYMHLIDRETFEVLDSFHFGNEQSVLFGHLQTQGDFLGAISSRNRLYLFQ